MTPSEYRGSPIGEASPSGAHVAIPKHDSAGTTILVVDACVPRSNSIVSALEGIAERFFQAKSTSDATMLLNRHRFDLAIIDLYTPGSGGINLCRKIKDNSCTVSLPVWVISRFSDLESEIMAMDAGADAFLSGNLEPRSLRARLRATLRRRTLLASVDETETVLFTLAQSVEERDAGLGQHCERLATVAASIGTTLGLPAQDIFTLQRGGFLHDVGKVGIPDSVLLKAGPLTPDEWAIMKTHSERGERICSGVRSLAPVLPIIRHHHEKWDGSGYPDGLRGDQIPLLARILQLADIYDALTAARPYKRAFTADEALDIIHQETAKGWRDPYLVGVFTELLPDLKKSRLASPSQNSLSALAASLNRYRREDVLAEEVPESFSFA